MLVLSRKQGEQLQIGDNVTITVIAVRGHRLTLGIQAPNDVRILRAELDPFREPAPRTARRRRPAMQLTA